MNSATTTRGSIPAKAPAAGLKTRPGRPATNGAERCQPRGAVEVARALWRLVGAPDGLIAAEKGPAASDLRPWDGCALDAFETLVASLALCPDPVRGAIVERLTRAGGFSSCAPWLLAASPEAYLALAQVQGLAETLANAEIVKILSDTLGPCAVAVPTGSEALLAALVNGRPGLPLVYEVLAA